MNLKSMSKEELEIMSYTDLAYAIIKENKKTLNTPTIFKEICNLLDLSDDAYMEKIGDFYTSLTTDKRFLLLDSAEWDIRDNHAIEVVVDDEDEEEEIEEEDALEIDEESEEIDELDDDIDDLDDTDDEMEDLNLLEEEELEDE